MNSTTSPVAERVTRSKSSAGEWSGTPSDVRLLLVRHRRLDGLRAADDRDPVAAARAGRRTSSPRGRRRSGPGTSDARACSSSIAIGSPSARRRRLTERIGSDGETWRMRPRRAPAGIVRRSSVRLAGVSPRARMSSLNERDVDALRDLRLGDERAGAAAANEVALAHELVERRAHRQPRDAEVDAELPLGGDRVADARAARSARARARASRAAWSRRATPASSGAPVGREPRAGVRVEEVEARRVDRELEPLADARRRCGRRPAP